MVAVTWPLTVVVLTCAGAHDTGGVRLLVTCSTKVPVAGQESRRFLPTTCTFLVGGALTVMVTRFVAAAPALSVATAERLYAPPARLVTFTLNGFAVAVPNNVLFAKNCT